MKIRLSPPESRLGSEGHIRGTPLRPRHSPHFTLLARTVTSRDRSMRFMYINLSLLIGLLTVLGSVIEILRSNRKSW